MTPSRRHPKIILLLGVGLWAPFFAAPVLADWLVTRDGTQIETRGAWRVEEERVVFTHSNGTLSTLRVTEVDLDASEALTSRRASKDEAVQKEEIKKPEPAWTLTDADVPRAAIAPEEFVIESLIGAEGFDLLKVDESFDATGTSLVVTGYLKNSADIPAADLKITVHIVSAADGGPMNETLAVVDSKILPAGSATRFVATFPDMSPGDGVVQVEVGFVGDDEEPLDFEVP